VITIIEGWLLKLAALARFSPQLKGSGNSTVSGIAAQVDQASRSAMRRKRALQSLAIAPKPPFDKDAANGSCEPAAEVSKSCRARTQRENLSRSCEIPAGCKGKCGHSGKAQQF